MTPPKPPLKRTRMRVEGLNARTRPLALRFLLEANLWLSQNNWGDYTLEVTDARRDIYVQAGLYSIGRKYTHHVGWKKIGPTVTNTLESHHLSGNAFDVALYKDGKYYWPDPKDELNRNMWLSLAKVGESLGLYPGALWANPDYPHYSSKPA